MAVISWDLVAIFAASGIAMALLSSLVGMPPKLENPLWWALYAVWVATALILETEAIFSTLLVASVLSGLLHGATTAALLDRYIANNPWHAERMQGPKAKLAIQFVAMGLVIGTAFGAIVAGLAYGITML